MAERERPPGRFTVDHHATDITIVDYIYPGFTFDLAENEAADTGNANDWTGGPTVAALDVRMA